MGAKLGEVKEILLWHPLFSFILLSPPPSSQLPPHSFMFVCDWQGVLTGCLSVNCICKYLKIVATINQVSSPGIVRSHSGPGTLCCADLLACWYRIHTGTRGDWKGVALPQQRSSRILKTLSNCKGFYRVFSAVERFLYLRDFFYYFDRFFNLCLSDFLNKCFKDFKNRDLRDLCNV